MCITRYKRLVLKLRSIHQQIYSPHIQTQIVLPSIGLITEPFGRSIADRYQRLLAKLYSGYLGTYIRTGLGKEISKAGHFGELSSTAGLEESGAIEDRNYVEQ